MADLTPEVMHALVRVMKGEVDVAGLTEEQLYALAEATRPDVARSTLYAVLVELNNRRIPFAEIGSRLGVHEATASRWARPPAEDRRRRR